MTKRFFTLLTLTLLFACAAPQPVKMTPPAAYLQLPPMPAAPAAPANNLALINYLFSLHDSVRECRGQIRAIASWAKHSGGRHVRR